MTGRSSAFAACRGPVPAVAAALAFLASACLAPPAVAGALNGDSAPLGAGRVNTFVEVADDGSPRVIALRFDAAALENLPAERNGSGRCFDVDGDGAIAAETECEGDYELRLPLPPALSGRDDVPFGWVMLNWNPMGHPPAPWQTGHFDVHFYMIPEEELNAIGLGPCGFLIDCAAFERALVPVPAQYVHPDHISVEAAVGGMGNHLIDSKTPELNDPHRPFTHTWIFGAYDGRISFYEVMLTREHMQSGESGCHPIKQPAAWQRAGWYPTRYCIRHDPGRKVHEVSMEDFVLREAS